MRKDEFSGTVFPRTRQIRNLFNIFFILKFLADQLEGKIGLP